MKSMHLRAAFALWITLISALSAQSRAQTTRPASPSRIDLLAIADWGMNNDMQRRVAAGMCALVQRERPKGANFVGVLCGGDNIYLRNITGVDDPRLRQVFSEMYDPNVLNFPFFLAPGNHDYDEDKLKIEIEFTKTEPTKRWIMPSNYYDVALPKESPLLQLYVFDSERDHMTPAQWAAQTALLEEKMKRPRDPDVWRIALAHHPLFSNGDHGDVGPLKSAWGEPFKNGGLDLYVAGHDHDLQHLVINDWPFSFLLVGGGGARTRPIRADARGPFSKQMNGFAHIALTREKMTVSLCDSDGNVVHQFERGRDRKVRVLQTTPSDKAQPRTVKSINRPDLAPSTGPTTKSED